MVRGFQTLEDRDNIDHVETSGPFMCNRPDAWLGFGYYFWDTNIQWAKDWGHNSYKKKDKEFIIASCMINTENCFDLLGSVAHQMELIDAFEAFNESKKLKHYHRRILPNVIQYLKKKGVFEYKSIRACDNTNKIIKLHFSKNTEREEYMLINQRVQICVIEKKDVILRPFTVVFPEKYIP
jgi:hypothetical protein